ncbi:L,D-transpeptidase family protein [Rubritalea spongiae]|uniref:L,D-transpeptidase family protein n=1 Tax=Rubritalea spongiae TaxID=430797 RepID=A0ABW5E3H3_9BACT
MLSLLITIHDQSLRLLDHGKEVVKYTISSAKNGPGSEEGSFKTPLGNFIISEKHGQDAPLNTIFKGRKPIGQWDPCECCDDDLVTTRILWLDGLDPDNANTKSRYIYIHGTNHEDKIGIPHSCGCIRMKNTDIVELFDTVTENTPVRIEA